MTTADDYIGQIKDAIGNELYAVALCEGGKVQYADGPYIVFADGSSISVSVTTQEAE